MVKKKKAPQSTKKRGTRRVAPRLNTSGNTSHHDSTTQPRAEPNQIVVPTNSVNQNITPQPTQPARETLSASRITILVTIIAAIPVIIQVYLSYPGYQIDVNTINAARATQTANAAIGAPTVPIIRTPSLLPDEIATPTLSTTNPADTASPTNTTTLEPEYIKIRKFLDDLGLLTERAIYEANWELITEYYCGEQSIKKLGNFQNWIRTLGTNAVGRRLIENRSLDFFSNPKPNIDWEVSQIEIWLFSGDMQQLTLKYTDRYIYYLNRTNTNSYCIIDFDTELIAHEILQK